MEQQTIMEQLRQETAQEHHDIEQNAYAIAIMDQTLTSEQYLTYLQKFYGFIKPLEDQISLLGLGQDTLLDMHARKKTPLLEKDIQDLLPKDSDLSSLPIASDLPTINSTPHLLGYLYVIEGSTMGGQIINKKLKQHLPSELEQNLRYFNAYGQETRSKWKEFAQIVNDNIHSEEDRQTTVTTAKKTFKLLTEWINLETPIHSTRHS
ncbi:biliverdin-producing heme oxygenase [Paenibacillus sp. Marseille-Q4541]|uniref:biliverdin-producing heme oxygenase n=1 Tax=Paenibacillus sp. Marseille-Q4541 TaxID=2831522 RepID=UPI001BA7CB79|nr:biliverdin-producing heme oxygenase [Paenibacillus sp. Marseille-Q4541]